LPSLSYYTKRRNLANKTTKKNIFKLFHTFVNAHGYGIEKIVFYTTGEKVSQIRTF